MGTEGNVTATERKLGGANQAKVRTDRHGATTVEQFKWMRGNDRELVATAVRHRIAK